jgi:8-oxo-dGTP pyrophosphatase MutT (NUDIX family)
MPPSGRPARKAREERSAGGIVFRRDDGKAVFLLIRDSYRNWGFPKGHIENGEDPEAAALREVREETGLTDLAVRGEIAVIDWFFRFRGRLIHKTCHFYLLETNEANTTPQLDEGITACRWTTFRRAERLIAYPNARAVLRRARALVDPAPHAGRKPG